MSLTLRATSIDQEAYSIGREIQCGSGRRPQLADRVRIEDEYLRGGRSQERGNP
jgi:hypothetical protein